MKYNIYKPAKVLEHIVRQYCVLSCCEDIEKLMFLPNGGNFLIFNKGFPCQTKLSNNELFDVPTGFSAGLKRSKAASLSFDKKTPLKPLLFPLILVELTPIGFYKLFNQSADKLTTKHLTMDDKVISKYFSELYSHKTIEKEIKYMNKTLQEMEASNNNKHIVIEDILDSITNKHYFEVTVEELMAEFKYTRKTMERQFKKFIGLTPKNFIYLMKFCKTFLGYVQDTKSLKDIAYHYSDNAHFNVVFQNITGYTPSELFNAVKSNELKIYQINQNT